MDPPHREVPEAVRTCRRAGVRVIMITANEGSRHKAYAEMLGVDDYIRKPFAMERLLETVNKALAGTPKEEPKAE